MHNGPLRILFVGHRSPKVDWSKTMMARESFINHAVDTPDEVIPILSMHQFHLVIVNITGPAVQAKELVKKCNIVATGFPRFLALINSEGAKGRGEILKQSGYHGVLEMPYTANHISALAARIMQVKTRESARVLFRMTMEGSGGGQSALCTSIDVSETGARLESPRPFNVSSPISLKLMGPGSLVGTQLDAKIVREEPKQGGNYVYGVHFTFADPAARINWENFIKTLV